MIRAAAACLLAVGLLAAAGPPAAAAPPLLLGHGGGSALVLVDAARLEPRHRIALQAPLAGRPVVEPTGRFAYFGTRDGWLTRYDLETLAPVRRVRAGAELRDVALSADGRWVLAGNASPHTLVLYDAALDLVRTYPAAALDGRDASPVSSVHDAPARRCFVVAFDTLPELWEISYDHAAGPIFDGLVHDYRMGEAIAKPGFFGARRSPLAEPVSIAGFDPTQRHVLATARAPGAPAAALQVINLDVRRRIAALDLPGAAGPPRIEPFARAGGTALAVTQPDGLAIVEPRGWRIVGRVAAGPGVVVRTHPDVPHLWVGTAAAPGRGARVVRVDKETLAVEAALDPGGGSVASIDFSPDGRRALVGLDEPGSFVVYETRPPAEVGRWAAGGGR